MIRVTETHPPQKQRYLLLFVLMLSSALSIVLSLARVWYSDTRSYLFLNWNLLLAWAPLLLAFLLWRLDRRRGRRRLLMMTLVFVGWLLFLPNSPYIVSDLMHLSQREGVPLWYDAIMLFSFAWNGLILGFVSLWIVQQVATRWFGHLAGWVLVLVTLTATGFGIYLGRFQRWNSWDVLVDPLGMFKQWLIYLLNPRDDPRTVGVTLLFGGFLTIAYLTLTLLPAALRPEKAE